MGGLSGWQPLADLAPAQFSLETTALFVALAPIQASKNTLFLTTFSQS